LRAPQPFERHIEVGELLTGAGSLSVAADVFVPTQLRTPITALFCTPGGAMNRHYFDLRAPAAPAEFSFAAHLTARGFIVVALDPLGIGDSSRPRDGFALTADVLAEAGARATTALRHELAGGTLTARPLGPIRSVGVGHSMGAMLTALQQAQYGGHEALMLFGFGTQGLPAALSAAELQFANDPAATRANIERLARARGPEPYPEIARTPQGKELFAGDKADRRGVEALQVARDRLLMTSGLFSMIPGSTVPECARIDTPLLLAVGDRDIAGPPHQIPASFPGSRDVTLWVLPDTGHCHFLFDSRRHLFARAGDWCEAVLAGH
jgi:pimeloyl-ACP methyl ester carboxylesterase